ncbi:MAG: CHRD domain-containing protein, partial [Acidimicrobiia bacterium]|nr:CHRD domain-containing protein [Acidimicrobiia bacterium]
SHLSDPAFDTADFNDNPAPGNLRADYVLPSANLDIADSGVFWPESTDPLFSLVGTFPFPSSDHRLVWVDLLPGTTDLPPAAPPAAALLDIGGTLAADGRFATLADALGVLGDPPPGETFTLLAPTDEAFDALPPGLLEALLDDRFFLTDVLLNHLIGGTVPAETIVTLTEAQTLLGAPLTIEVVEGIVLLNGEVQVIETDILASNGVIHVIDGVLLPPPPPEPLGFLASAFGRGSTEVPGPGDPAALTSAFIDVFEGPDGTAEVCFFVNTSVQDPTVAHIHRGAAGEAGPPVVATGFTADSWTQDQFAPLDRFADGCVDVEQDLALEIIGNPAGFYFNLHSASFPGGATREQLVDADGVDVIQRAYTAAPLLGANEVPGPGDPDSGRGFVDFLVPATDNGEWCFSSTVFRVGAITSGHIHIGAAGESGGVVLNLEIDTRWPVVLHPSGQGWVVNGCVAASAEVQSQIAANPGGFYVNYHNDEFPAGAVRAQLVAGVGEVIRFAELSPPDGFDPDVYGFADLAMFSSQGLLCWDTPNSGIGEPTGMSISDATGVLISFDVVTHPFLADVNFPGVDYTSFGCQGVDSATIDAIVANPNDYTFSIDTATATPALTGALFDPNFGPPGPPPESPPGG